VSGDDSRPCTTTISIDFWVSLARENITIPTVLLGLSRPPGERYDTRRVLAGSPQARPVWRTFRHEREFATTTTSRDDQSRQGSKTATRINRASQKLLPGTMLVPGTEDFWCER
jgi:hypothetical protein